MAGWMDQFRKGKKAPIAKGKKAVNSPPGKLDRHATDPGKMGKVGQKPKLAPMFRNKK